MPPLLVLVPQVTEKLLEVENETMMKVADLEKLLLQKDKDLQLIRVSATVTDEVIRKQEARVMVLLSISPW